MNLLMISDPPGSGYGTQTENILLELKKHNINSIWCFINARGKTGSLYTYKGIKCFNAGFTNNDNIYNIYFLLKSGIDLNMILILHDPRFIEFFFRHLYNIVECPIIYWHLWDNFPVPEFNFPLYRSSDAVVCGSYFTYKLLKDKLDVGYIPLSVDTKSYYPVNVKDVLKNYASKLDIKLTEKSFVVGAMHRNIKRKRLFDILKIFNRFKKDKKDCLLVLKTDPYDYMGFPLLEDESLLGDDVIFVSSFLTQREMCLLYNIMNVHIDISLAEGFGMTVLESLSCGVPNVVSYTGGLRYHKDVLKVGDEYSIVYPKVTMESGFQPKVYINQDYVSEQDVILALNKIYHKFRYGLTEDKKIDIHNKIDKHYGIENVTKSLLALFNNVQKKKKIYYREEIF